MSLETEADAEALAEVESILEGALIVSDTDFEELPDLPCLKHVEGGLNFWRNNELRSLRGLSNLETLGGATKIDLHPKLEELGLHRLREAHGLNLIRLDALQEIDLPALERATSLHLWNDHAVSSLGNLTNLEHLENLVVTTCDGLERIDLPNAATMAPLERLDLSTEGLESLAGIPGRPARLHLSGVLVEDLSELQMAESMTLIELVRLPNLTSLAAFSSVTTMPPTEGSGFTHLNLDSNPSLTSLAGLENLEVVDGHVSIQDNVALADVSALAGLESLKGNLWIGGSEALTSLDAIAPTAPGVFSGVERLDIRDNTVLPTCDAVEFAEALTEHGSLVEGAAVTIDGNAADDCGG